jgi:hypothetical protein
MVDRLRPILTRGEENFGRDRLFEKQSKARELVPSDRKATEAAATAWEETDDYIDDPNNESRGIVKSIWTTCGNHPRITGLVVTLLALDVAAAIARSETGYDMTRSATARVSLELFKLGAKFVGWGGSAVVDGCIHLGNNLLDLAKPVTHGFSDAQWKYVSNAAGAAGDYVSTAAGAAGDYVSNAAKEGADQIKNVVVNIFSVPMQVDDLSRYTGEGIVIGTQLANGTPLTSSSSDFPFCFIRT